MMPVSKEQENGILFLLICISDFLQCTYTALVNFLHATEIGNKIYPLCPKIQ